MVIANPAPFRETYLPQDLLHRRAELEQLARRVEPAARGRTADDVLVTGEPGVGKTALSRHVLRRLDATAADAAAVRVPCLGLTEADVLRRICAGIDLEVDDRWTATDLRDLLREAPTPTIVLLDEADDVPETGAIASLVEIPALSIVATARDAADWLGRIDGAHRHGFEGDGRFHLDPYDASALADILQRRATRGLVRGSWTRGVLERIADDVDGIARAGIRTLYAAATVAEENGRDAIREVDVEAGLERARRRIRRAKLSGLSFHHLLLYSIVAAAGEIGAGELHDRYESLQEEWYRDRALEPVGRRSRRYQLATLRASDLVACEGANRHRRYRVRDETIAPPIAVDRGGAPTPP